MESSIQGVFIQKDGRLEKVAPYVLAIPKVQQDSSEIFADASLYDLILAALMTYDIFITEAAKYSDQDLFDVCKTYDMNYDEIRNMVKERRDNG